MKKTPLELAVVFFAVALYAAVDFVGLFYWTTGCNLVSITQYEQNHTKADDAADQKSCRDEEKWWEAKFFSEIHVTDVLLAIFTGFLVVVGGWQGYQLRRTVESLETTAERQLRAYISLRVTRGSPPRFDPKTGPWIAFDLRNAGQTPAFELAHWCHAAIGPLNFSGPFPIPPKEEILHKSTLAPGTKINFIAEGPEPQSGHFDAFIRGELAAFVWGEITYIDAFKNPRFYRFRYIYTASDITAGVQGVRFCEEGNEAN